MTARIHAAIQRQEEAAAQAKKTCACGVEDKVLFSMRHGRWMCGNCFFRALDEGTQ